MNNCHEFSRNMLNAVILGFAGPHDILYVDEDLCLPCHNCSTSDRSHNVCVMRNLEKRTANRAAIISTTAQARNSALRRVLEGTIL